MPDGGLWELGRGAMGVTYRAFDSGLRVEVALKVIAAEKVADANTRARFQREARAAAKIRHPHVASVLHLGEQGGEFFYAMEFIAGRSLAALLAEAAGPVSALKAEANAVLARGAGGRGLRRGRRVLGGAAGGGGGCSPPKHASGAAPSADPDTHTRCVSGGPLRGARGL